ncbi:aminopeptidase O isoform X3 [Pseudoliparis swirei]|uniref:aminopeptidase O isoform X3 n=1 Tax=Pseudoliparis swirei TaxID=2059687 RepID=UPI0024BEC71A|nr:aminopeptidase O isoform X3 [Pseudoliparis swirei]
MEPDEDLNPDTDDLPLRANTNHILVRHYVLDLAVHFDRKVISGSVVLFLEPRSETKEAGVRRGAFDAEECLGETPTATEKKLGARERDAPECQPHTAAKAGSIQSSHLWETTSDGDFTLLLDCCDLDVSKVEEVAVASASATSGLLPEVESERSAVGSLRFHTDRWSLQVRKKGVASPQAFPRALRIRYETRPAGGSVRWTEDQDNRVCVYTAGSPINNRALFPCQEPPVAMSTWQATVRAPSECVVLMSGEEPAEPMEDEDTRSLIWNYYVTMPMPASTFTLAVGHWRQVLAENPAASDRVARDETDCGGTATLGAGPGERARADLLSGPSSISEVVKGSPVRTGSSDSAFCGSSLEDEGLSKTDYSGTVNDGIPCSHGDYPCRFTERSTRSQRVVPHRVFGPACLLQKAQMGVLRLLPRCLAAAHAVLGLHPFPRLDVLIVPAGFSSLGMASPHITFLSQSVLCGLGSGENDPSLCGSRICHEIAHSWFGLVIGARDWTEEWISEGFATYLEDIIWAQAQQLSAQEAAEQSDLKALLRWRRLSDELQNSEEALQILRPNAENTGQLAASAGPSAVKHALNPDKPFMQVHYLKGYFLLRFLASQVGETQFMDFLRVFVKKYHGQLILSQDFLRMLLITFPDMERKGLTLSAIYADWLDRPGIPKVVKWILLSQSHQGKGRKRKRSEPEVNHKEVTSEQLVMLLELLLEEEKLSAATLRALQRTYHLQDQDAEVRHRWCELVVKHAYAGAYGDVEHFLVHDQAMGVYLYGELMVREDPEQQALARRCLSLVQEEIDQSARRVVEEMVL